MYSRLKDSSPCKGDIMYKNFKTAGLLILASTVLSGCVAANQDVQRLQNQVSTQQQTIQQLNSQLSGVQPAQADTWMQIQTLRQEMSSMRGILDNIEIALQPLGGTQALAEKLAQQDRALRLAEAQLGLDLQLDDPALPQTGTTNPLGGSAYTPTSTTTPAFPVVQSVTPPVTPAAKAEIPQQTVSTDTAQQLYDSGIKAFNERRYDNAVNAFTDFITTFPQNTLISNAYYWQGESYYQLKNYAAAALAYENVISQYPNSNRAPAAYLKQGMSFRELGKNDAAKERLNALISEYPKAPEATRAKQIVPTL